MADFEDFKPHTSSTNSNVLTAISTSAYRLLSQYPLLLFGLAILAIVFTTRFLTARKTPSSTGPDGAAQIPQVPYYFPLLGHIPNMAHDATTFTRNLRSAYAGTGAYSLNFFGTVHNVLFAPPLATALLNTSTANAQSDEVFKGIMDKVFGWPVKAEGEKYDAFLHELNALYKNFTGEPGLGEMTRRTALKVRETIGEFVTFSESLVDQMLWERCANAKVKTNAQGERVMEVDLLQLVRDWCARSANPSIIGSDFINNFPNFFEELWTLDRGFLLLATGLPRWVPIPLLTRAHIARKNILDQLEVFERAMDKHNSGEDAGAEWRDLDDVGPVVRGRQDIYRRYDVSMRARAATEHALMWAANANSNSLVFWMLERIYADKVLLAMLREEIAPYVQAVQHESGFAVEEMPRLEKLNVDGLCANCPLLKSCYIECLRVDTASWSLKVVRQDFVLSTRDKEAQKWMLKKGEYVHVAHDLHNTDPNVFEHPDMWKPDRHVKYENGKAVGADMGSIRPYGGGHSMCKGRAFAFKECMMFAAAIISLWEIEPVGGGQWKMPSHKKATGVYATGDSTRVWIKKRQLPKV